MSDIWVSANVLSAAVLIGLDQLYKFSWNAFSSMVSVSKLPTLNSRTALAPNWFDPVISVDAKTSFPVFFAIPKTKASPSAEEATLHP